MRIASPGAAAWAAAFALGLLAYRPLWAQILQLPGAQLFEAWLFRPAPLPLLGTAAAAILLWWRRGRWAELAPRCNAPATAIWLALGVALFTWAQLTRTADLLLPSLAAVGLAVAAALRGAPGWRLVALPAATLWLGVAIPPPFADALVWQLQLWAASGAALLLALGGFEVQHSGAILVHQGHTFYVIDGCSGLRGILILFVIALIVRELFSRVRQWQLLILAPILGYALNAARIAWVVSSSDPEALAGFEADHTPQGIAVLCIGTAALYLYGWASAATAPRRAAPPPAPDASVGAGVPGFLPGAAVALASTLLLISWALPPFADAPVEAPATLSFPREGRGWTSETIEVDPLFVGTLPKRSLIHRRYRQENRPGGTDELQLLIARELPGNPASSALFSPKLTWPGSDWERVEHEQARVFALARDADISVATRNEGEHESLSYVWRIGDRGAWTESARSLFALEASPLRRERERVVVRLVTPLYFAGVAGQVEARKVLDRFIADFRKHFDAL